jgi:hypothetical protein
MYVFHTIPRIKAVINSIAYLVFIKEMSYFLLDSN